MAARIESDYCPEGMLDSYLFESFQLLEQMEEIVLSEENAGFFDSESINEIFRILHTIKGSSSIMMYDNITAAAHKLEDIFYYLRESQAEDIPKAELAKYIFQVSDFVSGELYKIKDGRNPDGNPQEAVESIETYLRSLKEEIREKGLELPPDNVYTEPERYYIAPAQEKEAPLKIDLGEEPIPGDYVIKKNRDRKENLVGVSMDNLEKLMLAVEKLERLEKNIKEGKNKESVYKKFHKVKEELKDTVGDMMQAPVGGVLRKMNRVVFDVSNKLEKDIELKLQGEGILVDRMLLEQITDSLMHLVRNAADHGIESVGERLDAGKPITGTIAIKAVKQDDKLYIYVEDDGRGIDKNSVFEKAKKKKLVDNSKSISQYTDQEIYEFITCAGFTTKDMVTEISGRGVGMDVVADTLKNIGGNLRINSTLGKGTEITLEIPLE